MNILSLKKTQVIPGPLNHHPSISHADSNLLFRGNHLPGVQICIYFFINAILLYLFLNSLFLIENVMEIFPYIDQTWPPAFIYVLSMAVFQDLTVQ